jgi:predicted nucleic acid-binding protein
MKTTFRIDDRLMAELRREAARRGCTMSQLVETALRLLLQRPAGEHRALPPLPVWDSGGLLVRRPVVHDALTAILMREHGIRTIYTRDTDFHRCPFVEPVDPVTRQAQS